MTLADLAGGTRASRHEVRVWIEAPPLDMAAIYAIRREVFVEEQSLTGSVRDDPDDRFGIHVFAAIDDQIVGIGRATIVGDESQIAWVAVRRHFRGHRAGRAMMERLIDVSRQRGCTLVSLNAQTHALRFYEMLGFRAIGRRFYMSNIEHQHMVLGLLPGGSSAS